MSEIQVGDYVELTQSYSTMKKGALCLVVSMEGSTARLCFAANPPIIGVVGQSAMRLVYKRNPAWVAELWKKGIEAIK